MVNIGFQQAALKTYKETTSQNYVQDLTQYNRCPIASTNEIILETRVSWDVCRNKKGTATTDIIVRKGIIPVTDFGYMNDMWTKQVPYFTSWTVANQFTILIGNLSHSNKPWNLIQNLIRIFPQTTMDQPFKVCYFQTLIFTGLLFSIFTSNFGKFYYFIINL